MQRVIRERSWWRDGLLIVLALALAWLPCYLAGGASTVPPLFAFLPIMLAGIRFGYPGALLAGLIATLVAGPLTPDDVGLDRAQASSDWLIRGGFFVGFGLAMTAIVLRLKGTVVRLQQSAITDSLTGLANRELLLDRLGLALARRRRHGGAVAVMSIDLDDFKLVNDSLGHDAGDEVLRKVSRRLVEGLRQGDTVARPAIDPPPPRAGDTVARLGGDEFVVLLEDLREVSDAALVAERIRALIRLPIELDGRALDVDASLGIAVSWGDEREPGEILRDSDTAMHAVKGSGKGSLRFFEERMHREVTARTELTRQLRTAIVEDQLCLLYQPQVELAGGRMTGVEALVRWRHPEHGLLPPDTFIPIAEATGLIVALDDWVILHGCRQLSSWRERGLELGVAVNVSGRRLTSGGLADYVEETLRATGAPADWLELEITETAAVDHIDEVIASLERLRQLGMRIAIDDFGMGQSALSRLQTFPVDRLKIDRAFIAPLQDSAGGKASIAAAMIAMARSLELDVVAEGIETQQHLTALRNLGANAGQGYLFSRPVAADEIERLLGQPRPQQLEPESRATPPHDDALVHSLLAELQRLTGLDSTYLTEIDERAGFQRIVQTRNAGPLEIPDDLTVPWADTICRRSLAQGIPYTDDVGEVFADSAAARELGLQTYAGVPIRDASGAVTGTLCGVSSRRVALGATTLQVMEHFAGLIAETQRATDPDAESVF